MSRRAATVVALVMGVVAASCGQGQADRGGSPAGTTITFSIAVPAEEKPAIQELLSRFRERTRAKVNLELLARFRSHPASRVDLVTTVAASGLMGRLEADRRTGRPSIHLFAQDNLVLKPLVDHGLVQDLSEVEIPSAVNDSMIPARFSGRQLFLPFRPNVRVAYADTKRLGDAGATPPTTTEELRAVAAALKASTGRPGLSLSLAEGDPAAVTISEWIVSHGGDPLVLNDEGSVAAFVELQALWQEGLLARESLFAKFDTELENLAGGRVALAQNWSFTSAVLAKRDRLRRFHVYPGWRGPVRGAHVIGGDVLGMPTGVAGRQRAVALELAGFLMSEEAQELLVEANAWPSIRDDAYDTVPPEAQETFAAVRASLADGWLRPAVSHWPQVTAAMNEAVDRILLRNQPVTPVLDELHARVVAAGQGGP